MHALHVSMRATGACTPQAHTTVADLNIPQAYANDLGIKIIGDMPIYVGGHSVDVWAHQKLFELGPSGYPTSVSGVPPDAFSETGRCRVQVLC